MGAPVEVVNHRHSQTSGPALEDEVLPEIWFAAALGQQAGLASEFAKFGELPLVIEDKLDRVSRQNSVRL
ncbi:MAG: hypothetical protein DMG30_24575 [Acidobacteria bacterium]|nr:MAG: hypothetical protein DMG30_24575 [Acidobacteriota bacterium]